MKASWCQTARSAWLNSSCREYDSRNRRVTVRFRNVIGLSSAVLLTLGLAQRVRAQTAEPTQTQTAEPTPGPTAEPTPTIELVVDAGRPLQVALDQRVSVKRVGQPVTGTLVDPVYGYDRILIPAGTKV